MKYLLALSILIISCKQGEKEPKQHPWMPELQTADSSNWLMRTQADQNLCRDSSIYITVVGVDALYAPDTTTFTNTYYRGRDSGTQPFKNISIKYDSSILKVGGTAKYIKWEKDSCQLLRDSIKRLNEELLRSDRFRTERIYFTPGDTSNYLPWRRLTPKN